MVRNVKKKCFLSGAFQSAMQPGQHLGVVTTTTKFAYEAPVITCFHDGSSFG
ncbi:hypothetical protein AS9A_2401 [Hoyosella subflava DQS3-9A1]|uniref:Uncharacterized protein n=1 Tax=Hoyosella subflava (strain DSM 45089 / JCM 17490 / NBRC 109087 / DQS3-9A1) TaxID=443218 RepID=F6EEP8_HOYSD|nr:hypothetical protein AS9A_2401 [Hoyosella subflava DQS3-9A1]